MGNDWADGVVQGYDQPDPHLEPISKARQRNSLFLAASSAVRACGRWAWWVSAFFLTLADVDQDRGSDERGLGILALPSMVVLLIVLGIY